MFFKKALIINHEWETNVATVQTVPFYYVKTHYQMWNIVYTYIEKQIEKRRIYLVRKQTHESYITGLFTYTLFFTEPLRLKN